MANPNISLLGATYSDVAGVTLPKQGGGTATFPWVEGSQSITQNGTYDVSALAEAVVNVSGGGASNIVTGTFKGTTTGAAMDISLPYTGSGYPVVVVIYPKEGTYKSGGAYFDLIQRYAANFYLAIKNDPSTAPTYSGNQTNQNYSSVCQYRKSNATSSTTYVAGASASTKNYTGDSASGGSNNSIVTFKSDTKMSVFIASTSYGFAANIEYTYHVIYSS